MDSTDTKTILKGVDKRLAKAILSRLKALEKRKISINAMEEEALEEGLSPEEFREEVVASLKLMYSSKLTALSKTEEEIEREADRIVAGYEYKRNHAEDEEKEEDLNEIRDVERRMDAILGIYSPLISNLEKHANEYIERLNIPKEDAAEYKITEESLNAILNGGDDLIRRMSDIHYLILKKFVDVVNFKKFNEEYKAKTGHYYATDPNVLFRETVLKIYAKLQVHLNVVKKILSEKQKELSDAKINAYNLPEVFDQINKLLKRLTTLGDSMIIDPELDADLKSKILEGEALSNKVNEMLGKVTRIGMDAFAASGLTSITLPVSVTSIGSMAFAFCRRLTSIIVLPTAPPQSGQGMFDLSDCLIYVPAGSVDAYKAAPVWTKYASRIQAIQD